MPDIHAFASSLSVQSSATVTELNLLTSAVGRPLPNDYEDFLRRSNGAEGWAGKDYVLFFSAKEVIACHESYATLSPELLVIGSDGAMEAYAYDLRTEPWPLVRIPFIHANLDEAERLADSFTGFLSGKVLRSSDLPESHRGKQLHWIQPIRFGGQPVEKNRTWLEPEKFFEVSAWWTRKLRDQPRSGDIH